MFFLQDLSLFYPKGQYLSHLAFSSRKVYGFCGTPCRRAVEGVACPDGVPRAGVLAPSPMGLKLEVCSTCGVKDTGAGATRAVAVIMGTYVGTEAKVGFVGVEGRVTSEGGGDTAAVCVIGVTTFTGL